MPQIRPFRALRFDPSVIGELGAVVAPPYDVIDETRRSELAARSARAERRRIVIQRAAKRATRSVSAIKPIVSIHAA